jgi:cytosine/creatinine deaminase
MNEVIKPVFLLKKLFFEEVEKIKNESDGKIKGMVSGHAHLDRAYTVDRESWEQSMALMEEKWRLVDAVRKENGENPEKMKARVRGVLDMMVEQGVSVFHTHADADKNTGLVVVKAFAELKEEYAGRLLLRWVAHPTQGFLNEDGSGHDPEKIKIFEEACALSDGVGGLPSADRRLAAGEGDLKHMDVIFEIAKNLNKDIDVHIDQENNPLERDTEKLIAKTAEHGWEGRVNFLHCLSIAAHEKAVRSEIIKGLKDVGANVIVCPAAAITMKQHDDKMAPLHNSIAPVPEMIEAGVNVCLGLDNISDVYVPDVSGDIWEEVRMMAGACRYYKPRELAEIVTINAYKTFKLI